MSSWLHTRPWLSRLQAHLAMECYGRVAGSRSSLEPGAGRHHDPLATRKKQAPRTINVGSTAVAMKSPAMPVRRLKRRRLNNSQDSL